MNGIHSAVNCTSLNDINCSCILQSIVPAWTLSPPHLIPDTTAIHPPLTNTHPCTPVDCHSQAYWAAIIQLILCTHCTHLWQPTLK
jgi:hypothetical protein